MYALRNNERRDLWVSRRCYRHSGWSECLYIQGQVAQWIWWHW